MISNMEPGRELNAMVAEGVMGEPRPGIDSTTLSQLGRFKRLVSEGGCWVAKMRAGSDEQIWEARGYSTGIASAWEVVERLHELGWEFGMHLEGGVYSVRLWSYDEARPDEVYSGPTDSPAHAIALAAIKAVESDPEPPVTR